MAHPPNISKTQVVWCLSHISERTKTFRGEILRLFPNESSTICGNFIHDDEWSNDQLSFTQRCDHSSYDKFAILPEKNFPEPGATVISPDYEPERKMLVAESQFPGALRKLEWIRIKNRVREYCFLSEVEQCHHGFVLIQGYFFARRTDGRTSTPIW